MDDFRVLPRPIVDFGCFVVALVSNKVVETNGPHGVIVENVVASIADNEPNAIFALVSIVGGTSDVVARFWPSVAELRRSKHHLHRPKRTMM